MGQGCQKSEIQEVWHGHKTSCLNKSAFCSQSHVLNAASSCRASEQAAHHRDELLAFVQGVICVHEDALCLSLKVLLPLFGIHGIILCIIFVTQQAVAQVVHSPPAWLSTLTYVCAYYNQ